MKGKIVKGIAGFYYVNVAGSGLYECKAKGIFRKEKIKPLVGDEVEIEVLDETEKTGSLEGDMTTPALVVEDGGRLNGRSTMPPHAQPSGPRPSSPSKPDKADKA